MERTKNDVSLLRELFSSLCFSYWLLSLKTQDMEFIMLTGFYVKYTNVIS